MIGEKVTLIRCDASGVTVKLVSLATNPVGRVMSVTVKMTFPLLVIVKLFRDVVLMSTSPKARLAGDRAITRVGVAVMVRVKFWVSTSPPLVAVKVKV